MTPPKYIRIKVFEMTQTDFATAIGSHQSCVSDWERRGCFPNHQVKKIRTLAAEKNLRLDDAWFFEIPENAEVN